MMIEQGRSYNYKYIWSNNEKRKELKDRRCAVIAYGKKNSILVEFENLQREIVSRNSVRKDKGGLSERS